MTKPSTGFLWMGWLWSWGSMGRIEADIAVKSWLFGFKPCSGQGQFTLTWLSQPKPNVNVGQSGQSLESSLTKFILFCLRLNLKIRKSVLLFLTSNPCWEKFSSGWFLSVRFFVSPFFVLQFFDCAKFRLYCFRPWTLASLWSPPVWWLERIIPSRPVTTDLIFG